MRLSLLEGNEAIGWGALHAGCRFFAGYPITPATSIFNTMLSLLPPAGGYVVQGEDEIASMGYCIGASMAGYKPMTATSGPGMSLYSEHISFAIGSEIPLVIVDVQRLGPSTGYATRGAEGDIQFLRWGNSGGLPVIVLAPTDARDSYTLTIHAFNLAETFRCPVMIASNKEIGLTKESVDFDSLERPALVERTLAPEGQEYLPFRPMPGKDVPFFLPMGGKRLSRQTSSTHGEDGFHTIATAQIKAMIERLDRKVNANVDKFTFYDQDLKPGAETLILTYGVNVRAARQVCREMAAQGKPVSLGVLKTLWPVPVSLIRQMAQGVKHVVVAEMNLGQYHREIACVLKDKQVDLVGEMHGSLVSPSQIKEAVNA
jgi:2-oxoglutarate ferredoxin oxidoreductase subunit alpha